MIGPWPINLMSSPVVDGYALMTCSNDSRDVEDESLFSVSFIDRSLLLFSPA